MSQGQRETERSEPEAAKNLHRPDVPFRIILVMQGGGAWGAYYGGVYQALHESGLEPNWIIGTSIGAISGAIIAGNIPDKRVSQLRSFWEGMAPPALPAWDFLHPWLRRHTAKQMALMNGVPGFYGPNTALGLGWRAPVGLEHAALYSAAPLEQTLAKLIDFDQIKSGKPRFSFSLVHVEDGTLHHFDNHENEITLQHILASAALPPSFPAVRIDGAAYWDAGFYDNTPLEAAFEAASGCNSIIFAPNLWPRAGIEPRSLSEAWSRQKSITFASRADDQVARHVQVHRLRHIVRHLIDMLPEDKRDILREKNFAGHARESLVHLIQLNAHGFDRSDPHDDIDFSTLALRERWDAGYADTRRMIDKRPWEEPVALVNGVAVHDSET
jgi:NTE family protein